MVHDPEGYWEALDARQETQYQLLPDVAAPCETAAILRATRRERGEKWRCPRVELRFENAEAQQVLRTLIHEDTRVLAGHVFERAVYGLPVDEQERILNRVLNTMNTEAVVEILHKQQPAVPTRAAR